MGFNYVSIPQPSMALNALTTKGDNTKEMVPGPLQFANTMDVDDAIHTVEHMLGHARNIGKGGGRMFALAVHCHSAGIDHDGVCGFGYLLKIGKGNLSIGRASLFEGMHEAFKVIIFAACGAAQVSVPGGVDPSTTAGGNAGIGDGMMFCKRIAKAANIPVWASSEVQFNPGEGACPYGVVPMQGRWVQVAPSGTVEERIL
jgi:hypothetical protein